MKDVALFNQRIKNIVDTCEHKEPEKVPVGLDYINWPWAMAGTTLEAEVNDPVQCAEKYCTFMNEIDIDFSMNAGNYETFDAFAALGSDKYPLCADRCTTQHNQVGYEFISDEEYQFLIDEFHYFKNEYWPKRNIPVFQKPEEEAYAMLKEAAKCVRNNTIFKELITEIAIRDHSIVPFDSAGASAMAALKARGEFDQGEVDERLIYDDFPGGFFISNLDVLFDSYRGMMGIFEDLIEQPEMITAAIEAMDRDQAEEFKKMPPRPKKPMHALPPATNIYNIECFLSPSQFDEYFFSGIKPKLTALAEQGKKIYLKGEGKIKHLLPFLKELPKESLIIQIDDDDIFEMKKLIGDYHSICCGMDSALYAIGDYQRCIDYVKKSFDELAPGGGFLFYQNKPLFSPSDADPQLVKDVMAFAHEYAVKK